MYTDKDSNLISEALPIIHNLMGWQRKYVQIVKNLFHKAKEEDKDLYQCLMIYHNTPIIKCFAIIDANFNK